MVMPRAGYRALSVADEIADVIDEIYKKNRASLRRKGIFSKQQFILEAAKKFDEILEKGENK
jgi:hypothetical protein